MTHLTDDALDLLEALYPEKRNTAVQLSMDIEGSGGVVRTTVRCEMLQDRGLVFVCYETRGNSDFFYKLTVSGRMVVNTIISARELEERKHGAYPS